MLAASAVLALVVTPSFAQPPGSQQPGKLPLPPGYRPRTPPPQAQVQPARPATLPSSSGKVMYFQKPADALIATGGPGSTAGAVAQLNEPVRPAFTGVPDVPGSTLPPPPPPPTRYAPPAVQMTFAQPEPEPMQPDDMKSTSQKKKQEIAPVPEEFIKLPPRESVFMVYDDQQLEKAIMDRIREDAKRDKKYGPDQEKYLSFPPLPVISPPGVPYQPKTFAYEPRQVLLEPGYVVHRRLHFEERNAERQGWDLGPLQTLVSAGYFARDVLLLPQSVASGCVYGFWDTSAGKCLPGSPAPYYLYPPGLTLTGTVVEGVVVTGGAFAFFP